MYSFARIFCALYLLLFAPIFLVGVFLTRWSNLTTRREQPQMGNGWMATFDRATEMFGHMKSLFRHYLKSNPTKEDTFAADFELWLVVQTIAKTDTGRNLFDDLQAARRKQADGATSITTESALRT